MSSSNKAQKASKGMAKFLHVLYIINIVLMVIIALGFLSIILFGTEFSEGSISITARGGMSFPMDINNMNNFITTIIISFIGLIAFMIILKYTTSIFEDIGNGETPFTQKQIDRIKRISITLVVMGVIENIAVVLWSYTTSWASPIQIDFRTFVMAFIVYCIALIFDYGCELQQLSDETI